MDTLLLFIGGLGGWEVILIVALVVLLFGAKKIPELARGLGSGIREFKTANRELTEEEKEKAKKRDEEVKTESELHEKPVVEDTPVHHP